MAFKHQGLGPDFSPIPNCFLIIDKHNKLFLFCDLEKINNKFRRIFKFLNILEINKLEENLKKIRNKKVFDR